jgi:thiol-disulfide isomerase/thioredoxin
MADFVRHSRQRAAGAAARHIRAMIERKTMRKIPTLIVLSIFVPCMAAASEDVAPIVVGDQAPTIVDVRWVRGEEIEEWSAGHVYVIDFWATWCPPCIEGLQKLQALEDRLAPQDVHFIAVAVWPMPNSKPPEEVLARFPELSYSLAIDRDDATADALLTASRSSGLPTTMIVDRRGRVAWVGPPDDGFDRSLEAIVSGSYDIDAARRADIVRHRAEVFIGQAAKAERSGDFPSAIELIDEAIAVDPNRFSVYRGWQYEIALLRLEDPQMAGQVADNLLESPQGRDPYPLSILATRIVNNYDQTPDDHRDLDLALHCARIAVSANPDPGFEDLALLAEVYALRGDYEAALTVQQMAMSGVAEVERPSAERALAEYATMVRAPAK